MAVLELDSPMNKFIHLSSILTLSLAASACKQAPAVSPTPDPQLESMVMQQAESASPGSEMVNEQLFRGVGYDKGEFQDFRVELQAGQCYIFVGAADETVSAFQIFVFDPQNSRATSEKAKGREALAQHCPTETGTYKVQGKIGRGAGHFAIGVFGKDAPAKLAKVEEGPAKLDLEAMILKDAEAAAPGATQVGTFYTGTAEKNDFFLKLDKGTCYWFIGAAQADVDDYYIYLWDQGGTRLGQTKADTNKAQFGYCAKESSMFRVQVKVDEDDDAVKLGVFAKK